VSCEKRLPMPGRIRGGWPIVTWNPISGSRFRYHSILACVRGREDSRNIAGELPEAVFLTPVQETQSRNRACHPLFPSINKEWDSDQRRRQHARLCIKHLPATDHPRLQVSGGQTGSRGVSVQKSLSRNCDQFMVIFLIRHFVRESRISTRYVGVHR